jgi:hypothetical protein
VVTGAFEVLTDIDNDYYVSLNSTKAEKYSFFILFLSSVAKCIKCKATSTEEHHTNYHFKGFVMFFYPGMLACTNLPPQDTCPIPKVIGPFSIVFFNAF